MPFASKKQARYMHWMKSQGKLPNVDLNEWDKATDFKHLPKEKSSNKFGKVKKMLSKK